MKPTDPAQPDSSRSENIVEVPQEDEDLCKEKDCLNINLKKYTHESYLDFLKTEGRELRTDENQPSLLVDKPSWFNEDLFKHASSVYERHFMAINFAHLSGLLLLVRVNSIYNTLSLTGESDSVAKLFKRYYHTVKHVKIWYEGDIFDESSAAYRSLLRVRGMHNRVSSKFNRTKPNDEQPVEARHVHISKYDIFLTQFAFVGLLVTNPKKMGLLDDFSCKDLVSLLHFWRVIGYYLGASEEYNLCSYNIKDLTGLCETAIELEYKKSIRGHSLNSPSGLMSLNIIRSVKFIPLLTIYGIMRYLYEILNLDFSELESKRHWYSSLSYTLINLAMTRFLAYLPIRSFDNGLIRLSIYFIGKVEKWYASLLESKYGDKLVGTFNSYQRTLSNV